MKAKFLQIYLLLSIIEGILALILLFIPPSMEKNAVLFGYSVFRLVLGCVIFILLVFFLILTVLAYRQPRSIIQNLHHLFKLEKRENRLLTVFVFLSFNLIFFVSAFLFFASPLAGHLGILVSIYNRAFPIVIWLFLITAQTFALFWVSYAEYRREKKFFKIKTISDTILILFILYLTIFHWLVLIFQLGIFGALPYWFWQWTQKKITLWYLIAPTLFLISILIIRMVMKSPQKTFRNIVLMIALGYIIQVGFGFMAGDGFESIRDRFMRSGHNQYALHACDRPDLYSAVSEYEDKYSQDMFLGTKPPGIIAFYIISQHLSDAINPTMDYEGCYYRFTMFSAVIFPLISLLILFLLYPFSKAMLGKEKAYLPCILYLFFPNVVLMHLELDQILFPLLFLAGVYLVYLTIKKQSFPLAIGTGIFIYFSMYFTFALLPLLGLALAWIAIDYWMNRSTRKFITPIYLMLGVLLGMAILAIFMYFSLHYDFTLRYSNAIAKHKMHKLYEPGLHQIIDALMLNNIEFMVWSGVPMIMLSLVVMIKSIIAFLRDKINTFDGLVLAFTAMYVALNIMGQTRGEVGRLWIFLLPVLAIFAVKEATNLLKKDVAVFSLVTLQIITILLTYHFQDSIFM